MTILGYAYDADHHCESCMLSYAHSVDYSEYDFQGIYTDETITKWPGIIDLMLAVELEIIRDSENNAIHPVFSHEEWYNIGYGNQYMTCADCGSELDDYTEE
jgi:hypothetical protein